MPHPDRPSSDQPCSEPFWLATRYLSGDLSESESAAFELRLADDLSLAEALSRAVVLNESFAACAAEVLPASVAAVNHTAPRRAAWAGRKVAATLLAAAVLLAVGWFGRGSASHSVTIDQGRVDGRIVAPRSAFDSREDRATVQVVSAWRSLAESPESASDAGWESSADPVADASDGGVPAWMIAAVLTSAEPAPEGLSPADEPEWEDL